jgi:hypothetical protein
MNTTFVHGAPRARQRHLRDDLGTAQLAQQAALPGHAEHAADCAAHLGGHAQSGNAARRQQHALHRLPVRQFDQQASRAVLRGVFRSQARQAGQALSHRRQRGAQRGGQKVLQPPTSTVLGQGLGPQAKHPLLMAGSGTQRTQLAADIRQVLQGQRARIHHCGWKPLFLMMRAQTWA